MSKKPSCLLFISPSIPLNPANSTAFAIIDAIVEDAASLFPNRYFHVGGDEGCTVFLYLPIVPVNHDCWNNSAQLQDILQWMSDNNIADFEKLEDYFTLYAQNATSRYLLFICCYFRSSCFV